MMQSPMANHQTSPTPIANQRPPEVADAVDVSSYVERRNLAETAEPGHATRAASSSRSTPIVRRSRRNRQSSTIDQRSTRRRRRSPIGVRRKSPTPSTLAVTSNAA
jgi:hypothetical protein